MRMLRPALAIATMLLMGNPQTRAADLLPPDRPIAEVVDHDLDQTLRKEGVKPAPTADDASMVRRLTLDLVGRIPTAAESIAYTESTDPDKKTRLIDRLMASPGFVRHQATELDTMLMAGARGSLRDYLVKAVGENTSWDKIFRELMLPDQTDKAKKAAAEYLRSRVKDTDRLTAEVSSTFFGVNISCAQCHDHPLVDDWKQDHFYGMKAFLDRTFVNGMGNGSFLGEHDYGTVKFKTTEGVERQARMMFLTGRKVAVPDTKGPDRKKEKELLQRAQKDKVPPPPPTFSARASLVDVALQPGERDFFARAIVNRVWNRLFGRGLVMPLDQMHSANPPSHPELLAWLARDTIEHGYDLRRLVRGLVLSRGYARSSQWESENPPRPTLFAVALARPLTPMQLAASLRIATADPASLAAGEKSEVLDKRIASLEDAARSMADAFGSSASDTQIGVAEALLFSNGKRIAREFLSEDDGRLVGRLEKIAAPADQIETAVRNVLSRTPDDDERRMLAGYLSERSDRPAEACRQLVWALLTCAEFRFNH
ncbi:MAG: DUF1549 domain-containing protein [Isosphaeraceae bacterium]